MHTSTLSQKYQIVVPTRVREALKLKAGQRVYLQALDEDKALLLKQPISHTKALIGLGKHIWQQLGGTDKYIKQERSSWDKK